MSFSRIIESFKLVFIIDIFSTNNIAIGMVRGRRKYAFNPPKLRFQSRTSTPLRHHLLHEFYSHTDRRRDPSSGDYSAAAARQPTSTVADGA
jgi:hypothetical protein